MKLEYREWLDSVGGPGYVLLDVFAFDDGVDCTIGEGDRAWAEGQAKYYKIEMPGEKL